MGFSITPEEAASMFVSWAGTTVEDILCEHYERTVGNDNCVGFDGLALQILKSVSLSLCWGKSPAIVIQMVSLPSFVGIKLASYNSRERRSSSLTRKLPNIK